MLNFFRSPFRIVVVCHANETRSPFLAALLRDELAQYKGALKRRVVVESAGVNAANGAPLHPVIATIAFQRGLDVGQHRARLITPEIVRKSSLILTAEARQQQELAAQYPGHAEKIHTVGSYGGASGGDLIDPTGLDEEQYRQFIQRAEAEASRIATHIAMEVLAKG